MTPTESGWRDIPKFYSGGKALAKGEVVVTYKDHLAAIAATEARERETHKEAMGEMVREILELTYEKDETYEDRPSHMKTYGEAMGEMHQSIKAIAQRNAAHKEAMGGCAMCKDKGVIELVEQEREEIRNRLYQLIDGSPGQVYLLPHQATKVVGYIHEDGIGDVAYKGKPIDLKVLVDEAIARSRGMLKE
jgi:hypothetical protein